MEIDLRHLVDDRNRLLWDKLNDRFDIILQPSTFGHYRCATLGNTVTIYVQLEDLSSDLFTHELLHLYLIDRRILIGGAFRNMICGSNQLKAMLSDDLITHIGNCFDHIKMYDLYIDMGYESSRFISDYHTHKCSEQEITSLRKYYRYDGVYNGEAVDLYFGKFFAMCADFNPDLDYEQAFEALDELDWQLFEALDRLVSSWETFDVEEDDILKANYHSILHDFYEDMKRWTTGKKFRYANHH